MKSPAPATNSFWREAYTFDGFGNLTGKTPTAGSAPSMSISVNTATNQPTGLSFDANGNPQGAMGYTYSQYKWEVENRLIAEFDAPVGTQNFAYNPWGCRVWKYTQGGTVNGNYIPGTGEIYFYGATGQRLETYSYTYDGADADTFNPTLEGINIYFGNKLLQSKGVWVATDRLGSVRANSNGEAMSYFPYGEERTSTADGREKFGTYYRDGIGQDYAEQRYYNSNMGAFWSPDPGGISTANPSDPTTWNRYMYAGGDPANHSDRRGMEVDDSCGADWMTNASEDGPCCDPSGNSFLGAPPDPGCYLGGGGGGGSEPAAAPLECGYTGAKTPPGRMQNTVVPGGFVGGAYVDPITLSFAATGGTGNYSWSVTQYISTTGSETFSNGTTTQYLGNVTLDNLLPGELQSNGSTASFSDTPGIWMPNPTNGAVVSANYLDSFTTLVSVTSGGVTVTCPTILWQAPVTVRRGRATGRATVTGVEQ